MIQMQTKESLICFLSDFIAAVRTHSKHDECEDGVTKKGTGEPNSTPDGCKGSLSACSDRL